MVPVRFSLHVLFFPLSWSNPNDTYNAREGQHDDLVLALALACWAGESPELRDIANSAAFLPQIIGVQRQKPMQRSWWDYSDRRRR